MKRVLSLAVLVLATACGKATIEDGCNKAKDCGQLTGTVEACVTETTTLRTQLESCDGATDAFDTLLDCQMDLSCDELQKDDSATACKDQSKAFQDKLTACAGSLTP
jgi:hypothetical protein